MIDIPGNLIRLFSMDLLKSISIRYKLLIIFLIAFFIIAVFTFYILGTLESFRIFLQLFGGQIKNDKLVLTLGADITTARNIVLTALFLLLVTEIIFVFVVSYLLERYLKRQREHMEEDKKSLTKSLEEARGLQAQLEDQKESVELKIKLRTQELRDEQSRLEASINSLNMGYIMVDNLFNVIEMNDEAGLILGIDKKITENAKDNHLTLDSIQQILGQSVNLSLETKRCLLEKKDIQIKDVFYKTHYFKIFISPVDNVTNVKNPILEVIGAVILLEDVTDAKVLERSRDEFFSIASHELRTPLTVIRGNTSMIKSFYADKIKDPELMEMIEDTHNSSIRLITIVNDFLNVSRLEQRKMIFKKEPFEIEKLIDEVIRELSKLAEDKKIALVLQRPSDSPTNVLGDRDRSKEILLNLCNNSIKYTDKGSVTISIDKQQGLVKILITDTGKGIPDENKSLLFRKFQQASNNILTRDNTRSTGLGLYISKLMAEGMGGSVALEKSTLNVGSVFAFSLPAA